MGCERGAARRRRAPRGASSPHPAPTHPAPSWARGLRRLAGAAAGCARWLRGRLCGRHTGRRARAPPRRQAHGSGCNGRCCAAEAPRQPARAPAAAAAAAAAAALDALLALLAPRQRCCRKEARRRYLAAALACHPDRPGGDARLFATAREAYAALVGGAGAIAAGAVGPGAQLAPRERCRMEDFVDALCVVTGMHPCTSARTPGNTPQECVRATRLTACARLMHYYCHVDGAHVAGPDSGAVDTVLVCGSFGAAAFYGQQGGGATSASEPGCCWPYAGEQVTAAAVTAATTAGVLLATTSRGHAWCARIGSAKGAAEAEQGLGAGRRVASLAPLSGDGDSWEDVGLVLVGFVDEPSCELWSLLFEEPALVLAPGGGGDAVLLLGGTRDVARALVPAMKAAGVSLRHLSGLDGWCPSASPPVEDEGMLLELEGGVHALATQGDLVAAAGPNGVARIWRLPVCRDGGAPAPPELLYSLPHDGPVAALSFGGPHGELAVGGVDANCRGFLRVWDADRGIAVASAMVGRDGHCCMCTSAVRAVCWLRGRVVSGGFDRAVTVWDLPDEAEAQVQKPPSLLAADLL